MKKVITGVICLYWLFISAGAFAATPNLSSCSQNDQFLQVTSNYKLTSSLLSSMPSYGCYGFTVRNNATLDLNGRTIDFGANNRWAAVVLKGHKASVISTGSRATIRNANVGVAVSAFMTPAEAGVNSNVIWKAGETQGSLSATNARIDTVAPWRVNTSSKAWSVSLQLRHDLHKIDYIKFLNIKKKAIYVDPYARNVTISRNIIDGTGDMAIYLDSHSGFVTINDNTIKNCSNVGNVGLPCIAIDGSRWNTIKNNEIGPIAKPVIPDSNNSRDHRKSSLIELYKNCGEANEGGAYTRWIAATDNKIENNTFYVKQDKRHANWTSEFGKAHDPESEYLTPAINLNARYDWNTCTSPHRVANSLTSNPRRAWHVNRTSVRNNVIVPVLDGAAWQYYVTDGPKNISVKDMFIRYKDLNKTTGTRVSQNTTFSSNSGTYTSALSWLANPGIYFYNYDWRKTGVAHMDLLYRNSMYNLDNRTYECSTTSANTCTQQ